ncbi:DUF1302 family protein [Paraglaciecola arctica]|uniref:DUF1302 family protein n=1 Tax=Paraglaciecola arctica TaxID=1128911 RepID=UPI0020912A6B|nr:DUF1302 family protein [Paraglaciecola arctica]
MQLTLATMLTKRTNKNLQHAILTMLSLYLSFANSVYAASNVSTIWSIDYRFSTNLRDSDVEFSRFSITSETRFNLSRNWRIQLDARAEFSDDDVGLGTINGYSPLSRPLIDNKQTRLELDRAFIQWRKRAHSVTLGKQVTPWGVLDGVQITDRFDPVRRRDFIFTDVRPERIARWGARWRNKIGNFKLDTSFAFDGTITQQAQPGALFFTTSTRFTGGVDVTNTPVNLNSQNRNNSLAQSTFGARISHPLGQGDISFLGFRGPDTDPILGLADHQPIDEAIVVQTNYQRRTLYGAAYDVTLGETVLRTELAFIPDQPINIQWETPLQSADVRRLLVGFGIDWSAPEQWFINAQLAIDHIDAQEFDILRPDTDTIITLRAQRLFINGRLLFKAELLGTINQRDGVLRPELIYEYSDKLKLRSGIDWLFGDKNTQFGQFKDNSRLWFAATYTF